MAKNKKAEKVDPGKDKYAAYYKVVKSTKKPVPLKNGHQAKSGEMFRAGDVLCYPGQLDSLLAEQPCRIEAVTR